MLAYIHQIVGKRLIILRAEVILISIGMTTYTAAIGHIVRTRVTESLEHGIWPFLLNLQHNLTLGCIAVPMVNIIEGILESFHLGPQPFAAPHVVGSAMTVQGIITSTDVVAEMIIVKTFRTDEPGDDLIYLLIVPLATLSCPPAQRYTPAIKVLSHHQRVDFIAQRVLLHI